MAENSRTMLALKSTSKGKLHYDKDWFVDGGLKKVLEECTSPPALSNLSPTQRIIMTEKSSGQKSERSPVSSQDRGESKDKQLSITAKSLIIEKQLRREDENLKQKVKAETENRRKKYEAHTALLLQQAQSQLYELYFKLDSDQEKKILKVQKQEEVRDAEVKKKQLRLKEDHRKHARVLDEKLREAHRKQKEEEEQRRQKQADNKQKIDVMVKLQDEVQSFHKKATDMLNQCRHQQHICDATKKSPALLAQVYDRIGNEIRTANASGDVLPEHLQLALSAHAQGKKVMELLTVQVDEANKKGNEEEQKVELAKQEADKKKKDEEKKKQELQAAEDKRKAEAATHAGSVLCIIPETMPKYEQLQQKHKDIEQAYQTIVADPNMKKYKFSLQKGINTPINAISPTSGSHLRDKLQRLCSLLSGQQVDVGGGKRVSAAEQSGGQQFCMDLLAKKLVNQGDQQVSSNYVSAFAIAAVAVGVWCEFPEVGQLIQAHIHRKCPYLVPYYIPKREGQSSEEYYGSLGYNYEDGQLEKQDKFLKRMSGFMRLYAAMMVSTPPRGQNHLHPHGVEHGWMWMCQILSLEPRPFITATMVFDFLQVAGFAMMKTYGKQFIKLLKFFITDYLPKIKSASPEGAGGPLVRLETLLEKVVRTGNIAPPDGLLASNFWST